jgi:hypothetical protein
MQSIANVLLQNFVVIAIIMVSGTEDVEERSLGDSSSSSSVSVEEQEESRVEESTLEGSEEYDDEQEASDEDSECEEAKGGPPCEFCGQVPCDVVTFWDDICVVCDGYKDNGLDNNQVRFQAYREYTRLKHGVLRKYDRRPLPMCVRSEIMDSWPDPNCNYVGFQAAIKYAAEDSS